MPRYFTLSGQRFDLENLSPEEFEAIARIREADQPCRSDDDFLATAREVIRTTFLTNRSTVRALSGAVGAIYRDLWYRRQVDQAARQWGGEEDAARILRNIRTHPARIVHDAFLDIGTTQAEFARQFLVSRSAMTKLVQSFKPGHGAQGREQAFSTSTVMRTLDLLTVTPQGVYFDEPSELTEYPGEIASQPTERERLLLRTILTCIRELRQDHGQAGASTRQLTKRLSRLYNSVSVQFLDALVKSVLWSALDLEEFAAHDVSSVLPADHGEILVTEESRRSKRLFDDWEETHWAGLEVDRSFSKRNWQSGADAALAAELQTPGARLRRIVSATNKERKRLRSGPESREPYRTVSALRTMAALSSTDAEKHPIVPAWNASDSGAWT